MCAKHVVLLQPQTLAKLAVLMMQSPQSQTFAKVKALTMQSP
jgi:hypothetical protein